MKKLKINTDVIKALNPCKDRFDNWLAHYGSKNCTLRQFLALDQITHRDKLWVILRLVDNDTKTVFALDCVFSAAAYAAADAAAYAAADAAAAAGLRTWKECADICRKRLTIPKEVS